MHPAISYQLAQARIADVFQHTQREILARAARRDAATPRDPHRRPPRPDGAVEPTVWAVGLTAGRPVDHRR